MVINSLLLLGGVLLVSGCAGLLMVRLHNPRLLGLGWLGAALAAGGLGAFLLLVDKRQSPLLAVLLADLLVLASLSLLHLAVMEIVGLAGIPRFALLLLGLQAVADLIHMYAGAPGSFRVTVIGILVATQAAQTALLLLRRSSPAMRAPARFLVGVLFAFSAWNLLRSLATAFGLLHHYTVSGHPLSIEVQVVTFALYIAVGLACAFGFFWLTSARLTTRLVELAGTDPLTGVLNRRAFLRCLEDELERSLRFSDSFAVLLLDIDHFKRVNDRHGHLAGDQVLCAAAQNIQDAVRGIDQVARWGGEEFAILLPRADGNSAHIVAQRIRLNIQRAAPLGDKSKHIPITVSLGLSVYQAKDTVEAILARADAALYQAKSQGRNRVEGWSATPLLDKLPGLATP